MSTAQAAEYTVIDSISTMRLGPYSCASGTATIVEALDPQIMVQLSDNPTSKWVLVGAREWESP